MRHGPRTVRLFVCFTMTSMGPVGGVGLRRVTLGPNVRTPIPCREKMRRPKKPESRSLTPAPTADLDAWFVTARGATVARLKATTVRSR